MKLMKSKTIFVNQEVMKKLTCPMDFDKFPFDVQKCNFSMFDALNYADTLVFVDETKYIHDISENSKYYVKVEGLNYTTTWKGHSMITLFHSNVSVSSCQEAGISSAICDETTASK